MSIVFMATGMENIGEDTTKDTAKDTAKDTDNEGFSNWTIVFIVSFIINLLLGIFIYWQGKEIKRLDAAINPTTPATTQAKTEEPVPHPKA